VINRVPDHEEVTGVITSKQLKRRDEQVRKL